MPSMPATKPEISPNMVPPADLNTLEIGGRGRSQRSNFEKSPLHLDIYFSRVLQVQESSQIKVQLSPERITCQLLHLSCDLTCCCTSKFRCSRSRYLNQRSRNGPGTRPQVMNRRQFCCMRSQYRN